MRLDTIADSLLLLAAPVFVVFLALEGFILSRRRSNSHARRGYQRHDTMVSLALGVAYLIVKALSAAAILRVVLWVYRHRLFDLRPDIWWTWPTLFFAEDLCYYAFHRTSHRVRFFWASHVNHHSSQRYNLSTALRQPVTGMLTTFVFWLPLPLIGFNPYAVALMAAINLLFQFFIHTELVDRLGALEWVLNTPSHHRAHHGSNAVYLDRNYGGWLIVWDRLFGSFQEELRDEPVRYGLVHDLPTFDPLHAALHEWKFIVARVRESRSFGEALGWIFGPPDWLPARLRISEPSARA